MNGGRGDEKERRTRDGDGDGKVGERELNDMKKE